MEEKLLASVAYVLGLILGYIIGTMKWSDK